MEHFLSVLVSVGEREHFPMSSLKYRGLNLAFLTLTLQRKFMSSWKILFSDTEKQGLTFIQHVKENKNVEISKSSFFPNKRC